MADGGIALELGDDVLGAEILAHQPHAALGVELLAVIGDDSHCLLTAVLQGVKSERSQRRGIGVAVDPEYTAFLVEMIVVPRLGGQHSARASLKVAPKDGLLHGTWCFRQPAASPPAHNRPARPGGG